jgi:hypothetical protein
MSHDDFVQYVNEGDTFADYNVSVSTRGADCILHLDSSEIPLEFASAEGFESRMEKVLAAIQDSGVMQQSAA